MLYFNKYYCSVNEKSTHAEDTSSIESLFDSNEFINRNLSASSKISSGKVSVKYFNYLNTNKLVNTVLYFYRSIVELKQMQAQAQLHQ